MRRIQAEMKQLLNEDKQAQQMIATAFEEIGYGID